MKGFEGGDQPLSGRILARRHSALSRLRVAWDSTSMTTPADGPCHRVEANGPNRTPENSVVPSIQNLSGFSSQVPDSDAVSLNEDLTHAMSKGVDEKDHVVNETIDV